jgi:hypothetical protein
VGVVEPSVAAGLLGKGSKYSGMPVRTIAL